MCIRDRALLKELQSQNERMFLLTFLVMNTGETEQELETNVSVSYTHLAAWGQEEATSLPVSPTPLWRKKLPSA